MGGGLTIIFDLTPRPVTAKDPSIAVPTQKIRIMVVFVHTLLSHYGATVSAVSTPRSLTLCQMRR